MILKRIILTIFFLAFSYILPWWLTLICVYFLIIYFDFYVEGVLIVFIVDRLYTPYFYFFKSSMHVFLILGILIFVLSPFIKKRLLLY